MPEQLTLATEADGEFETHRKPTRRDVFLAGMDKVVRGPSCARRGQGTLRRLPRTTNKNQQQCDGDHQDARQRVGLLRSHEVAP